MASSVGRLPASGANGGPPGDPGGGPTNCGPTGRTDATELLAAGSVFTGGGIEGGAATGGAA